MFKPALFLKNIKDVFSKKDSTLKIAQIEEILITADIPFFIVEKIIEKNKNIKNFLEFKKTLKEEFLKIFKNIPKIKEHDIILFTGINGTGKTTTIAKLANLHKKNNKKVLLVAADTFRSGAIEQLKIWADNIGVDIHYSKEDADPASVAFDSLMKRKKNNYDKILIDTAGRLHTNYNLMAELSKIKRIIVRETDKVTTYITIDANLGKNSYNQAKDFKEKLGVDGIILTKYDSTAKGGVVVAIAKELSLPISYITYGEEINDIEIFNVEKFLNKLFEWTDEEVEKI